MILPVHRAATVVQVLLLRLGLGPTDVQLQQTSITNQSINQLIISDITWNQPGQDL